MEPPNSFLKTTAVPFCQLVTGFYDEFGKMISDATRPRLPAIAQFVVENFFDLAPSIVSAGFMPNIVSRAVPIPLCLINKIKVDELLGKEASNSLYDTILKVVLVKTAFDAASQNQFWATFDLVLAGVVYMQKLRSK